MLVLANSAGEFDRATYFAFDYPGNPFVIDWDALADDEGEEEGMPHEAFMAELDPHIEELLARDNSRLGGSGPPTA